MSLMAFHTCAVLVNLGVLMTIPALRNDDRMQRRRSVIGLGRRRALSHPHYEGRITTPQVMQAPAILQYSTRHWPAAL